MKSGKKTKIVLSGLLIFALPVLAYVVTRLIVLNTPMDSDVAILVACLITAVLILSVPYFMLKLLFHNAHMDRGERELEFSELPKHAQQGFVSGHRTVYKKGSSELPRIAGALISAVALPILAALAQRYVKRISK